VKRLAITPEEAMKPWTGDLDGMIVRGSIRVLTVYSKTFYFMNKGVQRGATYDLFRLFEDDLNKRLAKEQKLKQKHLKVRVVFIPVARDDLLPALVAGKGDIAASNLPMTRIFVFKMNVLRYSGLRRQHSGGLQGDNRLPEDDTR
jgi:membrane-bound lytic murein transglycosylase MltF